MRCTDPRTVGFMSDGRTICWSKKQYSREYATFQLPCGQCLACRLDYARQWAIRCVHESKMHEESIFFTATYDDEHLLSQKLVYEDWQKFMKKLRKTQNEPIAFFVTGEYGDENKRPHWHAILFNFRPKDEKNLYTNELGDSVFHSQSLEKIWGAGKTEYGSVTFRSAGYCARYAAKKLSHGNDGEHGYDPISKKSSKHAIGKKWIEKNWEDVFTHGRLHLADGVTSSIPRYYERWFKENHPERWRDYVTKVKCEIAFRAAEKASKEKKLWLVNLNRRLNQGMQYEWPRTRNQVEEIILKSKFKMLQDNLKL